MSKIKKNKGMAVSVLLIMVILINVCLKVQAVQSIINTPSKKASLTITKYEHANGSEENKELEGVEFTIYNIPDDIDDVKDAEEYVKGNKESIISYTKTTPKNGTVKFSELEIGRYLVAETNAPKNVLKRIESFLIDLPQTSSGGNGYEYDVTVYPKNITIYGSLEFSNVNKEGKGIESTQWRLQKQNDNGEWKDYSEDVYTTDGNGKLKIEGLEAGKYRIYGEENYYGYIVDASNPIEFTVDAQNLNNKITNTSIKLGIEKKIKLSDGSYGKATGQFATDTQVWRVISEVPDIITKMNDYCMMDTLGEGLVVSKDSFRVYGVNSENEEIELKEKKDYTLKDDEYHRKRYITFVTKNLKDYNKVIVQYETNFEDSIKNARCETRTELTYTHYIGLDGEKFADFSPLEAVAEVHTGAVVILKTNKQGEPLKGASFKIATSQENAQNGEFLKDENNEDLIATSNEEGYLSFEGLKYGMDNELAENASTDYWLVEVQAPSYQENGETKYYNLLSKPAIVNVNFTSGEHNNPVRIINNKNFVLPLTGGTFSFISYILGIIIIFISIFIIRKKFRKKKFCQERIN